MRPVSQAFLDTVRGSHTAAARARVLTTFQTGVDPDGTVIPIITGQVTADCTASVRCTLDLTTDGTGMWPTSAADAPSPTLARLLAPYGNEAFVERGVDLGGGVIEWCSLGYYRIETSDQDNPPDGPIRVTGKDRMQGIIDARLLAPRQFTAAHTYGEVVDSLVLEVYPTATIEWDDATDGVPIGRQIAVESDRFGALTDVVTSAAKITYWDHRGVLVIKALPDDATPVTDVSAGPGQVLVSMARSLTRQGVYNAVVATGEAAGGSDPPAIGQAVDDNPASPTYWLGRFGQEPRFYSSPLLTTDAAAASAALTILRKAAGLPYTVDFGAVPNPALEPYDCIRIQYSDRYSEELHVIESLTTPLVVEDPMTGKTRQQTVVAA